MAKERKSYAMVLLQGVAAAVVVYACGAILLAALLIRGVLPESVSVWVMAGVGFLAALLEGLLCARRLPMGTLPAAMAGVVLFVGFLLLAGAACWRSGINWTGEGGVLLGCVLAGGVLAGVLSGRQSRGGKRKRK